MIKKSTLGSVWAIVLLSTIAACGGQPYVYDKGIYNRDSEIFLKGITDRDRVTICYHKRSTTPAEVAQLAVEECGRFGKQARFSKQTMTTCPLLKPVGAVFQCLVADAASQNRFR